MQENTNEVSEVDAMVQDEMCLVAQQYDWDFASDPELSEVKGAMRSFRRQDYIWLIAFARVRKRLLASGRGDDE